MSYEVEVKYRLTDRAELERQLAALGASWQAPLDQADQYWNHPARDFAQTDEALRLRRVGAANRITYKGPKVDAHTKTRREIELELPPGEASLARWSELLEALGFRRVAEVRKRRCLGALAWRGRNVEIALDEVGSLGSFAELETSADERGLAAARDDLLALAAKLGLGESVRTSYLELLLAQPASGEHDQ